MPDHLPALIYLPGDTAERWQRPCMEYVARHGYELVAVVRDGWADVEHLIDTHDVKVIVVGLREHLPADRTPRTEAIEEEGTLPLIPQRQRPRLIPRDEAAGPG